MLHGILIITGSAIAFGLYFWLTSTFRYAQFRMHVIHKNLFNAILLELIPGLFFFCLLCVGLPAIFPVLVIMAIVKEVRIRLKK